MRKTFIEVMIVTVAFAGIAAGQNCRKRPHLKVPKIFGLTYERARAKVMAAGWKPHQTNTEVTAKGNLTGNSWDVFWKEKKFFEVTSCGSTNPGCEFMFKDKYDNDLYIDTYGIHDPAKRMYAKVTKHRLICDPFLK